MLKKTFSFLVLFLLLLFSVVAQEDPVAETPIQDPYDPLSQDSYSKPEFYQTVPPAQWQKEYIVWDKVPVTKIKDIPLDKLDYGQMGSEQRKAMISSQISANFDNIDDLTKDVNVEEAKKAIKEKYNVKVMNLGQGASLKDGKLKATYGSKEYVPIEMVSDGVQIEINEKGEVVLYGEANPPKTGKFSVDTGIISTRAGEGGLSGVNLNEYSGGEIEYEGNTLEGRVHFDEGQAYLEKGERVLMNDIDINAKGRINLYFDGEEHDAEENVPGASHEETVSYVSMDPEKGKMIVDGVSRHPYDLTFHLGNPFFNNMEEGDVLDFKIDGSTTITIQSRGEDLIPLVNVEADEDSSIKFRNGEGNYKVKDNRIYYAGGYIKKGVYRSVPFTLLIEGREKNDKIIFDNSDNYIFIGETYPAERSECTTCTLDFADSSLALFSKRLSVRGVEFFGDKKDAENVQKYADYIDRLPPEIADSIGRVQIVNDVVKACSGKGSAAACADGDTITISDDPFSYFLSDFEIFRHEAGHVHDVRLKRENKEFRSKWETAARGENEGLPYGKHVIEETLSSSEIVNAVTDGCASGYGTTSIEEDIAEYSQYANDPEHFKDAINPDNKWYGNYDPRVRKKVDLMYEYGFYSCAEYNAIINQVGESVKC
jgi:hypothetical protein